MKLLLPAMVVAVATADPAAAQPKQAVPVPEVACPGETSSCLASLRVDIDRDGKLDTVQLWHSERIRIYFVAVHTGSGRYYGPITGGYDPATQKVSLTWREGAGDLRCRNWTPGKACGYAVAALAPRQALYLSHSSQGDFVLQFIYPHTYRDTAPDGGPRTDGYFQVVPALDGPVTDDPWAARTPAGDDPASVPKP